MASGSGRRMESYEEFVKVHGLLLAASGLPECLHRQLFHKLSTETFDAGRFFQIEPCEDARHRQRRLLLTAASMPAHSHVFLVDHAWTFRLSDAYRQVHLSFISFHPTSQCQFDVSLDACSCSKFQDWPRGWAL